MLELESFTNWCSSWHPLFCSTVAFLPRCRWSHLPSLCLYRYEPPLTHHEPRVGKIVHLALSFFYMMSVSSLSLWALIQPSDPSQVPEIHLLFLSQVAIFQYLDSKSWLTAVYCSAVFPDISVSLFLKQSIDILLMICWSVLYIWKKIVILRQNDPRESSKTHRKT